MLGQSSPSSPEQQLLDDELARQIQRAFAALPDRLRSVATLRFVDNLSYEEIAHWQDISQVNGRQAVCRKPGAIWSVPSRAISISPWSPPTPAWYGTP